MSQASCLLKGTARQAHTENCRKADSGGVLKEFGSHSREERNERSRGQMKVRPMRQPQERVRVASAATRHWHQVQTAVATQRRTGSSGEDNRSSSVGNKRKADGEHPLDEDCGKQAVDSRKKKRREHVEENCEVLEDAGEDRAEEGIRGDTGGSGLGGGAIERGRD